MHCLTTDGLTNCVNVSSTRLLNRLCPHLNPYIGGFHRVIGDALTATRKFMLFHICLPFFDKGFVLRSFYRHKIVPGGQMSHQRFCINAPELFFPYRECNHRNVFRFKSLISKLFIKWHIGVTVDGRDNCSRFTCRELFDIRYDGLIIAVTKRRVSFHDILLGNSFGFQEIVEDFVGRSRVNIIGSQQDPPFGPTTILTHKIFNCRDSLLIGSRAGIEYVIRRLFALILNGIKQQSVQLLKNRKD